MSSSSMDASKQIQQEDQKQQQHSSRHGNICRSICRMMLRCVFAVVVALSMFVFVVVVEWDQQQQQQKRINILLQNVEEPLTSKRRSNRAQQQQQLSEHMRSLPSTKSRRPSADSFMLSHRFMPSSVFDRLKNTTRRYAAFDQQPQPRSDFLQTIVRAEWHYQKQQHPPLATYIHHQKHRGENKWQRDFWFRRWIRAKYPHDDEEEENNTNRQQQYPQHGENPPFSRWFQNTAFSSGHDMPFTASVAAASGDSSTNGLLSTAGKRSTTKVGGSIIAHGRRTTESSVSDSGGGGGSDNNTTREPPKEEPPRYSDCDDDGIDSTFPCSDYPSAVESLGGFTITPTPVLLSSFVPTVVGFLPVPAPGGAHTPPGATTNTNTTFFPNSPSPAAVSPASIIPAGPSPPTQKQTPVFEASPAPVISRPSYQGETTPAPSESSAKKGSNGLFTRPPSAPSYSDQPPPPPSQGYGSFDNNLYNNIVQWEVSVLQQQSSDTTPLNILQPLAGVMTSALSTNTPFLVYPLNYTIVVQQPNSNEGINFTTTSILLIQDPNASNVTFLRNISYSTSWIKYAVGYQSYYDVDYNDAYKNLLNNEPIQNETILDQIYDTGVRALVPLIESGIFRQQVAAAAAAANQSQVKVLKIAIPGTETDSIPEGDNAAQAGSSSGGSSGRQRSYSSPLSTNEFDLRRWIGLAVALLTMGMSTVLMVVAGRREHKLKQEALWGYDLGTEQDVNKLLNLGFMWQQGKDGDDGPPQGVIVFNKEKFGYGDDVNNNDPTLMGGFHNPHLLFMNNNGLEVTLPSSETTSREGSQFDLLPEYTTTIRR